jgi:hypothetical protein
VRFATPAAAAMSSMLVRSKPFSRNASVAPATIAARDRAIRGSSSAATRALLAWGLVSGPFYLTVGLVQALTREGFDLSRHALSLLMLGEHGWVQAANLGATRLMVLLTAAGFARVSGQRAVTVALGVFGVSVVASAVFAPDPMLGFPPAFHLAEEARRQ